jgi:glyoxylase I family protein
MLRLENIHHIAIICSNYEVSKKFYTDILGFTVAAEHYRVDRQSYKLDLKLNDHYCVELFSFQNPPARVSRPEACGLRHLAFAVRDIDTAVEELRKKGVVTEPLRIDEFTGKRFTFFPDPDNLPIELYEQT